MIRSRALRLHQTAAVSNSTLLRSVHRARGSQPVQQTASSNAASFLQPPTIRCFSSLFSSRHSGGTLKVVQIKADDALMSEATEEIIEEKRNKKSEKRKSAKVEEQQQPQESIEELPANATETKATKKRTKSSSKSSRAASQVSTPSDSTATDSHKPLSDDGWQVWDDISKPFGTAEEQAEFDKWQKILEEEEKKVDAELEEEEQQKLDEDDENAEEAEKVVKPTKERKPKKLAAENVPAKNNSETKTSSTSKLDKPRIISASADASKKLSALKEAKSPSTTKPQVENDAEEQEEKDEDDKEKSLAAKGVPGVLKSRSVFRDGVHTRMLNVGGEQVMEISGELEDDDGPRGEDEEEEWEDDVDLDAHNPELDASDPETQVGRGVGGVFFTRKDIMELNEKDLIESFTKGSGKGGQKVNKTSSCVHLLHLPTGTRVKCQFSRELQANRARARTIMRQRLEELLLGTESRTAIKQQKERKKKDRNRRRRAKKQAAAAEAESNEHENEENDHDDAEEEHEAEPQASNKDVKQVPSSNRKASRDQ